MEKYEYRRLCCTGILAVIMLLLAAGKLRAQHEQIWTFGKNAGLDFSSGSPVAIRTSTGDFGEANASVCDQDGRLLFYTQGNHVWDKNGNLMPGGANIVPLTGLSQDPTSSTAQGALIVPVPGDKSRYIVFSLTSAELNSNFGRLYYSVVDMSLNSGLGDVVSSQKGIFVDSQFNESMTAVQGNNCNVWLILYARLPLNSFKVYEITGAGLNPAPSVYPFLPGFTSAAGCMAVSHDRRKFAFTGNFGFMLYDFNADNGALTSPLTASSMQFYTGYGVCFSPDNTRLYVSRQDERVLYQYDLTAGNGMDILNSRVTLGYCSFSQLKLGPDGKIYFNSSANGRSLGVIPYPDLAAPACGYTPGVVQLLENTFFNGGLPNTVPVVRADTILSARHYTAACFQDRITVTASEHHNGRDYLWNTGATTASISLETQGAYWVTYTTPPCNYHADTFHLDFPHGPLPDISITPACRKERNGAARATLLRGNPALYTYTWMDKNGRVLSASDTLQHVPSGDYRVRIRTTSGCDTMLDFRIPEQGGQIAFSASAELICLGDTIRFTPTSGNDFPVLFWDFRDGTTTTGPAPQHVYTHPGVYRVLLSGSGASCSDTAYLDVTVDAPVKDISFNADPQESCEGATVTFIPETDSTMTGLAWDLGDGTTFVTARPESLQHIYENDGIMQIRMEAEFRACPAISATDSIVVRPNPRVILKEDLTVCPGGVQATLENMEAAKEGDKYLWNTGSVASRLMVAIPGFYHLAVTNRYGCTSSAETEVKRGCFVDIPNAFTPNGDGINDYFFPADLLTHGVQIFHMQIFNRWGQRVFETKKADSRGWDGRTNGTMQSEGVYIYLIEAVFITGQREKYTGSVTLIP